MKRQQILALALCAAFCVSPCAAASDAMSASEATSQTAMAQGAATTAAGDTMSAGEAATPANEDASATKTTTASTSVSATARIRRDTPGGRHIAQLPIFDASGRMPRALGDVLADRLATELRVPFNESAPWATYYAEGDGAALWASLRRAEPKAKPAALLRTFTKESGTDLAVCAVVERYYEHCSMGIGWEHEPKMEVAVAVTLYGYDARHDRVIQESASYMNIEEYHPSREAAVMLIECFDEVLLRANLKTTLSADRMADAARALR